jgi:hypothetical protein
MCRLVVAECWVTPPRSEATAPTPATEVFGVQLKKLGFR